MKEEPLFDFTLKDLRYAKAKDAGDEEHLTKPRRSEDFQKFWDLYPKAARASRAAAVRVWNKLPLSDKLILKIIHGLQRYTKSRKWIEEPRFIPHARTWLNQHRWEDFVEEDPKIQKLREHWLGCKTEEQRQYFIKNYGTPEDLGIL